MFFGEGKFLSLNDDGNVYIKSDNLEISDKEIKFALEYTNI
jgi:hypothetical protein